MPDNSLENSLYRVIHETDSGEMFSGTAFAIGCRHVLTCNHVIFNNRNAKVKLRGPASLGDIGKIDWVKSDHWDCALGTIESGLREFPSTIRLNSVNLETVSASLICYGFTSISSGIAKWTGTVSEINMTEKWAALENSVGKGLSGGPSIIDSQAVGITIARADDATQKYILPIAVIDKWLADQNVPLIQSPVNSDALSAIKIAPQVYSNDIPRIIVRFFASHFRTQDTSWQFIHEAMELRQQYNEEGYNSEQILIQEINIGQNPDNIITFWSEILCEAGLKSRRTLAAFFYARNSPNPAFADRETRIAVESFKSWLANSR